MFLFSLYRLLSPVCCLTANRLARDSSIAGEREQNPRWISTAKLLVSERGTLICAFRFSPQGLKASIIMPHSKRLHTHPSRMVSMMDHTNDWDCSNTKNDNAGFTFTEVSIVTVSTKQMGLTLEQKFCFTTSASQVTIP